MRDLFPTTPSERIAMTACYAIVGLLAWIVTHAPQTGAFLRGLVP